MSWVFASVSDLTISTRARNVLRYGRITTVGQLASKSDDELLSIPGMGVVTVAELRSAVRAFLTRQA